MIDNLIVEGIKIDDTNEKFMQALDIIENSKKQIVYLTGRAGTGKTTFLKTLRAITTKNVIVLAFTGIAAINAGGQTIHSFFQIPFGPFKPNDKRLRTSPGNDEDKSTIYDYFEYYQETVDIITSMELLVIDEISMVRCDLLDVIDNVLRVFRKKMNTPFGGVQMLLIGDAFQLSPIANRDEHVFYLDKNVTKIIKVSKY
jgi:predicted AAA+ superfamily ATPase